MKAEHYQDSYQQMRILQNELGGRITAGYHCTAGVKEDGTVLYAGPQNTSSEYISSWQAIHYVASNESEIIGISADGQLLYSDTNVSFLSQKKYIGATGGLDSFFAYAEDGSFTSYIDTHSPLSWRAVIPPETWRDIIAADANWDRCIVLTKYGKIPTIYQEAKDGLENQRSLKKGDTIVCSEVINDLRNVVDVAAGQNHFLILHSDGTVTALGRNTSGECNVTEWQDIVSISASADTSYGLKSNGSVVYTGAKPSNYDLKSWTDIVAIFSDRWHVVGLKAAGTVVAAGNNGNGQCEVSTWNLFD